MDDFAAAPGRGGVVRREVLIFSPLVFAAAVQAKESEPLHRVFGRVCRRRMSGGFCVRYGVVWGDNAEVDYGCDG